MKDKYLYLILVILIPVVTMMTIGNVRGYLKDERDMQGYANKLLKVNVLPVNEDKAGKKVLMRVSAYSSVEGCDDMNCIMANGKRAEVGYVACSRKYKLGTRMKIEGKKYVCGDRLSMKYDSRVDMFTGWGQEGYKKARQWGVRSLEVEIIN